MVAEVDNTDPGGNPIDTSVSAACSAAAIPKRSARC